MILAAVVRAFFFDVFYIPSNSMQPLLEPGDRVLVSRMAYASEDIRPGDVVVFDGRGSLAPLHSGRPALADAAVTVGRWLGLAGSDTVYVKRVIGVAGDRVSCCTDGGITVNGTPVEEPYVYKGDAASDHAFDVTVPQGRLWLMGDHRSQSADSRSLLGAPGGGLISTDRVIGEARWILWPLERSTSIDRLSLGAEWNTEK